MGRRIVSEHGSLFSFLRCLALVFGSKKKIEAFFILVAKTERNGERIEGIAERDVFRVQDTFSGRKSARMCEYLCSAQILSAACFLCVRPAHAINVYSTYSTVSTTHSKLLFSLVRAVICSTELN